MDTVDWLPPRPLRVSTALGYKNHDHIAECAPMLGVNPDPRETVVLLYVGIHDTTLYTAFDPDAEAWIPIERGPASVVIPQTKRVLDEAMAFLEGAFPDATFAALKGVDPIVN